jgi:hypothetical protein
MLAELLCPKIVRIRLSEERTALQPYTELSMLIALHSWTLYNRRLSSKLPHWRIWKIEVRALRGKLQSNSMRSLAGVAG